MNLTRPCPLPLAETYRGPCIAGLDPHPGSWIRAPGGRKPAKTGPRSAHQVASIAAQEIPPSNQEALESKTQTREPCIRKHWRGPFLRKFNKRPGITFQEYWPGIYWTPAQAIKHRAASNNSRPAGLDPRTRDAPGTHQGRRKASRRRTSEPGKLRADGDRPAWNSSLDPWPGSLLISGQNPRKSAKNRQKSTAARGPGDEGKGHVSHKYSCKI